MRFAFFKTAKGEYSTSLSMAATSYTLIHFWLLAWVVLPPECGIPDFQFESAAVFLAPMLALYFGRKWSKDHQSHSPSPTGE